MQSKQGVEQHPAAKNHKRQRHAINFNCDLMVCMCVKQPNDPKLSHRRLAAWIATAAPPAVGSGDWLGHWLSFNPNLIKSNAEMTAPHLLAA
jgi:hypothetical protein